ncbi:hypothetical protein ACMD2_17908 [Ananas comosus]|uniref:HPP transmembrane region domain-containing protein n=1 Tax=Ananas comosus TaxID=4615 RepID=A0A199W612_ANACO|nr:hypothetical protein ACMD2_17908 [Ananas comosus]
MRRKWRKNRVVVRSGTGGGGGGGGGGGSVGGVPAAAGDGVRVRVRVSDVLWPAAGAFAAMAALGRLDQMMAPRGLSITIPPLGAVCAVLFATPNSPAAQKYNVFMAQIGCSAFGVLALSLFGPGWLARGFALAASIAFMIVTGAIHPPGRPLMTCRFYNYMCHFRFPFRATVSTNLSNNRLVIKRIYAVGIAAASLPLLFIDGAKLHRLHLWYALFPGAAGCVLLCLIQEMVVYLKNNYKF